MNAPDPMDRPAGASGGRTRGPVEDIALNRPQDLPVAVPYLLGFHPGPGSLIVVALHGAHIALVLHLDASAMTLDGVAAQWSRIARPLAAAGTEHVALIGYLPETRQDLLLAFAAACPAAVLDVQRVHDGRWWSLTCPNGPDCCPPGQPLEADPALVAPLIAATGGPAASRQDVGACLRPGPAEQVAAVAALLPLNPAPAPAALYRAVAAAHTACGHGPIRLSTAQAALLLHALTDVRVRDACCIWRDGDAGILWQTLISYAPASHVAPVATLIATTAYQRGDTVLARMAAEHALTADPDYGLGQLILGVADAHMPPTTVRDVIAGALNEIADLPGYRELGLPRTTDPHPHDEQPHDDGQPHDPARGMAGGDGDG